MISVLYITSQIGSLWSVYSILCLKLVVYGQCTLYALPHGRLRSVYSILRHLGSLWSLYSIIRHLGSLWSVYSILRHLGSLWPVYSIRFTSWL